VREVAVVVLRERKVSRWVEDRQRRGVLVEGRRGWQKLELEVAGDKREVSWKEASDEPSKVRRIVELGENLVQTS
jgi:hypothetical protein